MVNQRIDQLIKERDEARAQVERLFKLAGGLAKKCGDDQTFDYLDELRDGPQVLAEHDAALLVRFAEDMEMKAIYVGEVGVLWACQKARTRAARIRKEAGLCEPKN